jgi:magnesium-transporting ATPase (P-type)
MLITKGAPEAVLARCLDLPEVARTTLDSLFADGERVVAVATRYLPAGTSAITTQDERRLTLAGFLTFADRPKPDAGAAVAELSRLGVDVKIITRDNGVVAAKVCREIGIKVAGVMNGTDLAKLDDKNLAAAIPGTTVFARVSPDQKSRIIVVARGTGKDVAFMGHGVNDAVAIHHADVGISVDSGTDVAKDAADVVLLEKDLGVLATGVMEGRRIFGNTMKYVLMATSSNFGNIFSAAGPTEFRTGWFVESIATQTLIIYVIRTRRVPFFRSRPSLPMMLVPTAAAAIGIVLPFTGLSHVLGFTPLPAAFFLVLVVLIVADIVLVDVAKALFYRAHGARPAVPGAQPPIPRAQPATDTRSARRLHRRAAPFIVHTLTGPGRWFLRPAGPDGKEAPSAAAGRDHRAGASHR